MQQAAANYLNGIIMANYLGYEFVDPAEAIRFNEAGIFDAELTNKLLSKRLADVERAVIPGFYGVMPDGIVQTFSRGGSDITGSIVAKAIQAGCLRELDRCFRYYGSRSAYYSQSGGN